MTRLTKKQRAEVVELLRCAADLCVQGDRSSALGVAASELDMRELPACLVPPLRESHWSELLRGGGPVRDDDQPQRAGDVRLICGTGYEFCLLEAAQRVEEGSWP